MANDVLPTWMATLSARRELEQCAANANNQRRIAAQKSIEVGAPAFFRQFIKELFIAANGCHALNLRGLLLKNKNSCEEEERWSISISAIPPVAKQTSADLFYATGDLVIHCIPSVGDSFNLEFVANEAGVVFVTSKLHPKPLDAEKAAQFLLEPMLKLVAG